MTETQSPRRRRSLSAAPGAASGWGCATRTPAARRGARSAGACSTIGAAAAAASATADARRRPPPAPPLDQARAARVVTFECSLCQTRMTARSADVGRKMACPDCGRQERDSAAAEAEGARRCPRPWRASSSSCGTSDEDAGSGVRQAAPRCIPVECRVCQTLMYATEEQIGGEMQVPRLRRDDRRPSAQARKTQRAAADAARARSTSSTPRRRPTPRPVPMPVAIRDAELHEHARATTVGPDGRLIVQKKAEREAPRAAAPCRWCRACGGCWSRRR